MQASQHGSLCAWDWLRQALQISHPASSAVHCLCRTPNAHLAQCKWTGDGRRNGMRSVFASTSWVSVSYTMHRFEVACSAFVPQRLVALFFCHLGNIICTALCFPGVCAIGVGFSSVSPGEQSLLYAVTEGCKWLLTPSLTLQMQNEARASRVAVAFKLLQYPLTVIWPCQVC